MIIIVLTIIRKFAKITINFYNGKINNININPELIETTVCFLLSLIGILHYEIGRASCRERV